MIGTTLKQFYTECVSYSRACMLQDAAKSWPAYQKWRFETSGVEGYKYLQNKIGKNRETTVFVDHDATNDVENFSGYSFKPDTVEVMKFNEAFLPNMSKNAVGMTMRDKSSSLRKDLETDIVYPEFYHEFGEFDSLEFTMG